MIATNAHFRYAEALIRTAKKLNADEALLHDLKSLSECFKDPEFKTVFKGLSYLKKDQMEAVIKETFREKVQPITMNLIILLARSRKLMLLPKIYAVYSRYYFHGKGIEQITIRTARKLSGDEESRLVEKLIQKNDKKVHVEFESDPSLIAGTQVLQKGFITDYSVKNYLETLKKQLLN